MPAYTVVTAQDVCGKTLPRDADSMIVFAADATAAKEVAASYFDGDGSMWSAATVTEIVAGTNWSGWSFTVEISKGFGTSTTDPARVTVLGSDTNETIDKVGALLVTALNALPVIANSSYNTSTNTLTVASAADGIGDAKVYVKITPPSGKSAIPSLVGTVTDGGVAAAALTVVLPADNAVIPLVAMPAKVV